MILKMSKYYMFVTIVETRRLKVRSYINIMSLSMLCFEVIFYDLHIGSFSSITCLCNGKQLYINHPHKKDLIRRILKMSKYYMFVTIVETQRIKVMSYINIMSLSMLCVEVIYYMISTLDHSPVLHETGVKYFELREFHVIFHSIYSCNTKGRNKSG